MESKVFVVYLEDVYDGCLENHIIDIFRNEDDANKRFKELRERFSCDNDERYITDVDTDTSYVAYEDGDYNSTHICLTIRPKTIM